MNCFFFPKNFGWPLLFMVVLAASFMCGCTGGCSAPSDPASKLADPRAVYENIDPSKIGWREVGQFPAKSVDRVLRLAVDDGGQVWILAKQGSFDTVIALEQDGNEVDRSVLKTDDGVDLTVGVDGQVLLLRRTGIDRIGKDRQAVELSRFGPEMFPTSICVCDDQIYVADAKARVVRIFKLDGKPDGQLPTDGDLKFIVPSPYFDLACGDDGLVRVVNPGRHRIEHFTADGLYEKPLSWGETGNRLERFCGCCNPARIALFPDGPVVTFEKKIPRIKVYRLDGTLDSVVAGPSQLGAIGKMDAIFDIAVTPLDRIAVLDPLKKSVRVFEKKLANE
jgi:hypothetical protein